METWTKSAVPWWLNIDPHPYWDHKKDFRQVSISLRESGNEVTPAVERQPFADLASTNWIPPIHGSSR